MEQVAMDATIAVLERMDKNKSKCDQRGHKHWIIITLAKYPVSFYKAYPVAVTVYANIAAMKNQ